MHTLDASCLSFKLPSLQAGGVELASDLELQIFAGKVTILAGPNGAGKSTLLNHLSQECTGALLYRPSFGLRDELSVMDQAEVFNRCLGESRHSTPELLNQVGLLEWGTEKVMHLSSGQRARLGMVSMLASGAKVWMLDEPLNALDFDSLQLLATLLKQHLQRGGFVLLVSHLGQQILAKELPCVQFDEYVLANGKIQAKQVSDQITIPQSLIQNESIRTVNAIQDNWIREYKLALSSTGSLLWSGLFLFMVLSFFGLVIRKPEPQVVLAVTWMAVILCCVLSAKDWFLDDFKCGWLRLSLTLRPQSSYSYWLSKVGVTTISLWLIVLPVAVLGTFLIGAPGLALEGFLVALFLGVLAIVPVLALISLMVLMTRGGAVLVYILALPLLVPVMIFGLEASQAASLGRSALPALGVLVSTGALGLLLGPWVAQKLLSLILE